MPLIGHSRQSHCHRLRRDSVHKQLSKSWRQRHDVHVPRFYVQKRQKNDNKNGDLLLTAGRMIQHHDDPIGLFIFGEQWRAFDRVDSGAKRGFWVQAGQTDSPPTHRFCRQ